MSNETKHCNLCDTTKPLSEFYMKPNGAPRAGCKDCLRADSSKRNPDYQRTHPESTKAKVRRWQKKNPDRVRALVRAGMKRMRRKRRERGTPELPLDLK
jgi:ribosome-binding protein aMBF1 (putative translation factor)